MVPARADGIAPRRRHAAKVTRGPNLSQDGPATRRTRRLCVLVFVVNCSIITYVAVSEMILELAISFWLRRRSFLIVRVNYGVLEIKAGHLKERYVYLPMVGKRT